MADAGTVSPPPHAVASDAARLDHLRGLLAVAEALATTEPPHEMILARLVAPLRIGTGLAAAER